MLPHDAAKNVNLVWAAIKEEYTKLKSPSRYGDLRPTMFRPSGETFPNLKGRANDLRHFGAPLLAVWKRFMDSRNKIHRFVKLLLEASVEIERLVDKNIGGHRYPRADAKRFEDMCFQYASSTTALANFYHPRNIWLFHYTIKFHYLLHIGQTSGQDSPSQGWCYQGEDFMQKTKTLVQSSCRGSPAEVVANKVLAKYIVGLSYANMHRDSWWR